MSMILKTKKTKTFRSLWITLATAFMSLSAVVLLVASSLNIYLNLQNQQQLIINKQRLIAQNAAHAVKSFIQEKLSELNSVANLGKMANVSQQEQKTILEQLLGFEPAFRQLVLLNKQNQEAAKVSRLSSLVSYGFIKRISDEAFSYIRHGKMYIGPVYIDEITSEPMVIMGVPAADIFGDFKGALFAEVNLKFMWDLIGGIKVGNKGSAYVVDKNGNLIASSDISRVLKGENVSYLSEVCRFVGGSISVHKDSTKIVKGIQGDHVVANHVHLGTPDWAVVVELPVLEAYETVITSLVISGLVIFLGFVLAIIAGIYLSKRITKPIINLRDAAVRIGQGRLDTRIEIKKEDEIGDLAAAFNQMAENLRKTTTSVDNLNREIAERKRVEERLLAVNSLQKLILPPAPIEQKLKLITDAVVRILDADFARVWVIKQGDRCSAGCTHAEVTEGPHVCRFRDKCLHLMASSGRYTHLDGKVHRRVPFGCYKIGLVAAGKDEKFLTNEAATDPRVHNHDWVRELGLVSFAGYRLTNTDGTPLGVLALFSKHRISQEEDAFLEGIAHSTSMVIRTSQTEEELRKNEEFTRRIIESSSDCIKVLDLQGRLLSMSEGGQKLLELDDIAPFLNTSFIDFWKGKEKEACIQAVEKAKQGDKGVFYGYFETAKGKPKWWEVIITPIKDADGSINRLLAISRDITERKKAEETVETLNKDLKSTVDQLMQSNKQLQEFAHLAAHDLKTPLRGISTLAQWLIQDYRGKFDKEGRKQVDQLIERVEHVNDLVNSILQYSTITRERNKEVPIDLNLLVETTLVEIRTPPNIEITINKNLPVVICRESHIRLVFYHLITNAIKFMDKPEGRITINCADKSDFWEFSVSDNGPGIAPQHLERVFQFFQSLSDDSDQGVSSGMGLTISRKIIGLYGGKIWLTSELARGSTFFFTLPKTPGAANSEKLILAAASS
jgi:PAS domain S-box-containing protein